MNRDDDMVHLYQQSESHYESGLTRIGCTLGQAYAYGELFVTIRSRYWNDVDQLISSLPPGAVIGDIGMGLGHDLEHFCQQHPDKHFVGIELSPQTLEVAERRMGQTGLTNYRLSSNREWFKDAEFDLVINNCVFEHVASPGDFALQLAESLKPDGQFIFAVPNYRYWLFWNWPLYMIRYPFRGAPCTHSVKDPVMNRALDFASLTVERLRRYGFRPPQSYFSVVPESVSKQMTLRQGALEEVLRRCGFGSMLYLNLYKGRKGETYKMSESQQAKQPYLRPQIRDYLLVFAVYLSFFPAVLWRLVRSRLK